MKYALLGMMLFAGSASWAEILVPVRTIRPKEIIGPQDIVIKAADVAGALADPAAVIGREARVALYPGRPVRPEDIGPPAIVRRNDLVQLVFIRGRVRIVTEGRSLGRGAAGETIRAMNLSSRTTVTGQIAADGSIKVQ